VTSDSASPPALTAVVPTLGRSPLLDRSLAALRAQSRLVEVVLVMSGGGRIAAATRALADRVVESPAPLGFAAATNRGLALAGGELVATVNDDAVVAPDWAALLAAALERDPGVAAAQGVNLLPSGTCDGWGLAWSRRLQAIQLGHGAEPPPASAPPREVFGVSATAAVYRRRALLEVALASGIFDERLDTFYEDVDLAGRLRGAGWRAIAVPAARAAHAGSSTAAAWPLRRYRLLHRNRWLALARLLGSGFWLQFPRILMRDARDSAAALSRGELGRAFAAAIGWLSALARLPAFARRGPPLVPPAALAPPGDAP